MITPLSNHIEPGEAFDLNVYAFRIAQSYRRHLESEGAASVQRAVRALALFNNEPVPDPIITGIEDIKSLSGKVLWLIENEEPRTSRELAVRLGMDDVNIVSQTASQLFSKGKVNRIEFKYCKLQTARAEMNNFTRDQRDSLMERGMKIINTAAAIFLLCATSCFAQRGTLSFVTQAATVATPTNKQQYLTWQLPAGITNLSYIYWGTSRVDALNYYDAHGITNSASTTTNKFPITNGWHYVVGYKDGSQWSIPALWPSNRIGELWLTGYTANLSSKTNIAKLASFTNAPPGVMQLWGVENRTVGWQ